MPHRYIIFLALIIGTGSLCLSQDPLSFRTGVDQVVVDIKVVDKKGVPVPGLSASSFRLQENGVEQQIISFDATENDAATEASRPQPRFLTLVVDQANAQTGSRKALVQSLLQFIDKGLPEGEFVSIADIGSSLRIVLPFSRDRKLLRDAALEYFERPNSGAFTNSDKNQVDEQVKLLLEQERRFASNDPTRAAGIRAQRMALLQSEWAQTALQARLLFAGLRGIAQSLGPLPGRKTIVLFSEGFNHAPDARQGLALVIDAATRSNTAVYVINPAGLRPSPTEESTAAQYGSNETAGGQGRSARRTLPNTTNEQVKEIADSARRRTSAVGDRSDPFDTIQHTGLGIEFSELADLAADTGGLLIRGQNDLAKALSTIHADLDHTYTLTYRPTNHTYDGAFRKITVQVPGQTVQLRYRKGYWAVPVQDAEKLTPASMQLLAAVSSGALEVDRAIHISAAMLFRDDRTLEIPVSIEVRTRQPKGILVLTARDLEGSLSTRCNKRSPTTISATVR